MEAEAAAFLHGPRPGGGFGLQFLAISKSPLRPPVIFRQTLTPVPIFSNNLSSSFHISLRPSSTTKPGARPRWWHVVWLMLLSDLQLVDKLCQLRPMFRRFVSRSLRVERRMAAWVSRSGGIEQSLQPHLVPLRFLQNKHIFVRCSFHCQETFIWSFFSSLLFQVSPLNDSAFSWFSTHVVLLFWLHPTWFSFSLSTTSLGDALFEASRTVKNQGGGWRQCDTPKTPLPVMGSPGSPAVELERHLRRPGKMQRNSRAPKRSKGVDQPTVAYAASLFRSF